MSFLQKFSYYAEKIAIRDYSPNKNLKICVTTLLQAAQRRVLHGVTNRAHWDREDLSRLQMQTDYNLLLKRL